MASRKITVETSKLALQVEGMCCAPLDACEIRHLPIVEVTPTGRVEIIDGFHRIAGLIAGGATEIECVTSDDADLLDAAAEPGAGQQAAIDAIYAAI